VPHEVRMDITREACLGLLTSLAEDDDFRAEFVTNAREILSKNGIELGDETLPETIVLPKKEEIRLLLDVLELEGFTPGEAPFGFAIMMCVQGAMPVLAEDRPALDGTS